MFQVLISMPLLEYNLCPLTFHGCVFIALFISSFNGGSREMLSSSSAGGICASMDMVYLEVLQSFFSIFFLFFNCCLDVPFLSLTFLSGTFLFHNIRVML